MTDTSKQLLNLPLAEEFACTLRFDVDLPDPTPGPKLLFPSSGLAKLFEARITQLNVLAKPEIYTPSTLHLDLETLTLLAEERRGAPLELDAEEEELLEEQPKVRKNSNF